MNPRIVVFLITHPLLSSYLSLPEAIAAPVNKLAEIRARGALASRETLP